MLDPALRSFVDAEDPLEAERRLDSLVEDRVVPLVRKIVGRKLRTFGTGNAVSAEDIEDVASDAALVLIQRLQSLRDRGGDIESLDDYTAAVTYSVCAHHLRRRHPERSRLKNRVRYVLGRDPRLATWDVHGFGAHCGRTEWRGRSVDPRAAEKLASLERDPRQWPRSWQRPADVDRADPTPMIATVFELVGGAIELDSLVSLIAHAWQIERVRPVGSERVFELLADPGVGPEASLDQRRLAERLWQEITQLPVRQRVALLLNLRDPQGTGVLWIFPVTGVASMRAIADALEMTMEELAALWSQLPMDDNTLAERLACTRQQVINLRMSARKRLSNRLRSEPARSGTGERRPANLAGLSTSLWSDK